MRNPFKALAETPGLHWCQLIVWFATTATFPIVVFLGYLMAGGSLSSQIGEGQLLLVASTLTAPIVGVIITLPGEITLGRSFLFLASFFHVSITVFYFAAISDGSPHDGAEISRNSIWLYIWSVIIGGAAVMVSARSSHANRVKERKAALKGAS